MTEPVIWACGLSKRHRVGGAIVYALIDVSVLIEPGEFVAIVGRSGSGKSTLVSLLGLLDRPDTGHYLLAGRDVANLNEDTRASIRRNEIGFVFQMSALHPRSTAIENVEIPLVYAGVGRAERRRRAIAALDRVGVSHRGAHWPNQLSGGEQQRVAIARALVNDPNVILADEPTGSLDSKTGESILALFGDLQLEGRTIILVTHAREVAERAQRLITIHDGHIIGDDRSENRFKMSLPSTNTA